MFEKQWRLVVGGEPCICSIFGGVKITDVTSIMGWAFTSISRTPYCIKSESEEACGPSPGSSMDAMLLLRNW
jgi:hypothetical protein